jgi:hypothetical protein
MLKDDSVNQHSLLALAGGFIAATIAFLLIYQLGALFTHDKPAAFLCALAFSLYSLSTARHYLGQHLRQRR